MAPIARNIFNCAVVLSVWLLLTAQVKAQPVFAGADEEMHFQQVLAVQNIVAHQKRLSSVGYAILRAGVPECGHRVKPDLGFMALSKPRLPPENREILAEAMGLGEELKVLAVYKNGPAEKAGMKEGDIITDPKSPAIASLGESDEQTRQRLKGPLELIVHRQGQAVTLNLMPENICADLLRIDPSNDVNAFAQGRVVVVTRGMMRFASRERDLALVIAHEIAHNALGHTGQEVSRVGIDKVLDTLFSDKGARSIGRDAPTTTAALSFRPIPWGCIFWRAQATICATFPASGDPWRLNTPPIFVQHTLRDTPQRRSGF